MILTLHNRGAPMSWMYRLQQRLAITRHEATAIIVLSGLLLLGLMVQQTQAPETPADPSAYAEMEARFKARTAALPGANRPAAYGASTTSSVTEASSAVEGHINLNTASAADLQRLPGIGPALSGRIIAYRQAHGAFAHVDDITRVRGIGPKTLARLKPLLTVQ